jgi:hypothetical protein
MLECWNIGKMGFDLRPVEPTARRGCRTVGLMAIIVLTIKLKMGNILKKNIIPSFHYSIIPWPRPYLQKLHTETQASQF